MHTLHTPAQLSAYLSSLRKSQGLTQAALGARLGVSGARIGAIEQNPGAVSLAQLLRVLHALGARMHLDERTAEPGSTPLPPPPPPRGEW